MVSAIIAAAGSSRRMQGADKLLLPVKGRAVLEYAIEPFQRCEQVGRIVLVLRGELVEEWRALARRRGWSKVTAVVAGGARRQDSVLAGLEAVGVCEWVLVHDGARPCVTEETILRGLEAAGQTGAAIAAVPAKDTIKTVDADGMVTGTPPRESLWLVQTPQVFRYDILRRAYEGNRMDVTDDASLVEAAGYRVKVFMGSYSNIKVTTPEDLPVLERLLAQGRR